MPESPDDAIRFAAIARVRVAAQSLSAVRVRSEAAPRHRQCSSTVRSTALVAMRVRIRVVSRASSVVLDVDRATNAAPLHATIAFRQVVVEVLLAQHFYRYRHRHHAVQVRLRNFELY